jgi:hypothetical protein
MKNSQAAVTVTCSGVLATEIRRVAENLKITPSHLARILLEEGLKDKYGISVK